jgi:RNA polymerase sigma factor, sigma-70 family
MNNKDLAKIVKQVKSNKEKYFEKLFNEIYRTIYYLSFKFLNNETEAQDVSQDIIVYIYHHIEELKVPEGFNRWMNRIIYSKCKNHIRTLSNRREDDYERVPKVSEEQTLMENPEKVVQTKERNQFILEIINDLPMKQQEVVLLYYYQQLTAPEIADVLSCSLPSVQNRLYKAKKAIESKVKKATKDSTQQFFAIGIMPILVQVLAKEANQIIAGDVQGAMWKNFLINKNNVEKPSKIKKSRNKAYKYKANTVRLCLGVAVGILLLIAFTLVPELLARRVKENAQSEVQNQSRGLSEGNESQPEEKILIIPRAIERNTIPIKIGIDNERETNTDKTEPVSQSEEIKSNIQVQIKEESQKQQVEEEANSSLVEDQNQKFSIFDISTDKQTAIWNQGVESEFTNTAFIIDKDLEDMKYTSEVGGKTESESMYQEEEYKKDSEIVYHAAVTPIISFRKSSLLTEDIIYYYIHLENIGEVAAYNIAVQDVIPEYTEYIQLLYEQSNSYIQVEAGYKEDIDTVFWTIEQFLPQEAVTLGFQVRVKESEYQQSREIKNIAYMKVIGKNSEINGVPEEQGYLGSNEVVHIMQLGQEQRPKTGDGAKDSRQFIILGVISSILIIYIQDKKRRTAAK